MALTIDLPAGTQADPAKPVEGTASTPSNSVTKVTADASALDRPTEQQKPADRPTWLPEKFKTPEDMAKAYGELEKKLGGSQKPEADADVQKATDAVEKSGVDLDALSAEFMKNGKLSDESYQQLEKAGIKKPMVDAYIAGQQAIAKEYNDSIASAVGGEEALKTLFAWAKASLTPAEIAEANKALASGNVDLAQMTVKGIQARYTAANGKEPSLLEGNVKTTAGAQPFRSNDEIVRAMSDKRYETDEAYRQDIANRMAVTDLFSLRY